MKKKFKVEIAAEECKGCNRCAISCPKSVLKPGRKINAMGYAFVEAVNDNCIGCGACFYQCPEPGAVTVWCVEEESNE